MKDIRLQKESEIKPAINLDQIDSIKKAEKAARKLRKAIRFHNFKYYVEADPVISDSEYDKIYRSLVKLEEKYPDIVTSYSPTQRVGGQPIEEFEDFTHPTPMLSLQSVNSEVDVKKFYSDMLDATGKEEVLLTGEPKYDGVAVELIYEKGALSVASTRGDGQTGDNITENIKTVKEIPLHIITDDEKVKDRLVVRGEVLIYKKEFEKLNQKREKQEKSLFANPRNAAAGSIRQLDPQIVASRPLHIFIYEMTNAASLGYRSGFEALEDLRRFGFNVNLEKTKRLSSLDEVMNYFEALRKERSSLKYEIDGAVFKVDKYDLRKKIGKTSRHPKWAIAYKFEPYRKTTRLLNIQTNVGRTGRVTPVASLDPVEVGGVTIKNASLHNFREIEEKDIRIGDTVVVKRAGDVIPQIVRPVVEKRTGDEKKPGVPQKCPVCDTKVTVSGDKRHVICPNFNCRAQIIHRIVHFASRKSLNITGLGEKTVRKLFRHGLIQKISDIFYLKREEVLDLEGFSDKSTDSLLEEIDSSRKTTLSRFVNALGIPLVGTHIAGVLSRHFRTLDDLQKATKEDLLAIRGIGPNVALSIVSFFDKEELRKEIERIDPELTNELYSADPGKLNNVKFVFTGKLKNRSREEAKAEVEKLGGRAVGSISSEVDFLVKGEDPGSKLKKAQKQKNIKIIDEKRFEEILNKGVDS